MSTRHNVKSDLPEKKRYNFSKTIINRFRKTKLSHLGLRNPRLISDLGYETYILNC